MNNYLQSLISVIVISTGILIVLFYFFSRQVDSSSQEARINQNINEIREANFSQTERALKYIYITLVIIFLLVIYFLVPRQKLG